VLVNVRAEPLLFLSQGTDMIPYRACTSDSIYGVDDPIGAFGGLTVAEAEVALRKEVRHCLIIHYDYVVL